MSMFALDCYARAMSLRAVSLYALLMSATPAFGHSWIEQASLIDENGHFAGAQGYPRGYVARTDPTWSDPEMTYLIPQLSTGRTRIDSSDLLCGPTQRTQNQTTGYPRLQVAAGSAVALKYLENGHVSLPQNQPGKAEKGGTVFVFGTENPRPDETLMNVLQWNRAGTGGDKKGMLLSAMNYDDGRCHQINSGTISQERVQEYPDPVNEQPDTKSELWCESDVIMPLDLKPGSVYTFYWVWQWPTMPGIDPNIPNGKDEYYSSCGDFDVVRKANTGQLSNKLKQQDPMMRAHKNYMSRSALVDDPLALYATISLSGLPSIGTSSSIVPTTPAAATPIPTFSMAQDVPAAGDAATPLPSPAPQQVPMDGSVVTALVTVTATMVPGQSILVVQGTHVVTFTAPEATLNPRDVERMNRGAMLSRHRRRHARRRSQPDLPQLEIPEPPAVSAWGW